MTFERGRAMLATTEVAIVEGIHVVAENRRHKGGSHLALTMEWLEHLAAGSVRGSAVSDAARDPDGGPSYWSARARPSGRARSRTRLRDGYAASGCGRAQLPGC